jgi:predicted dehydrogenase
LMAGQLAQRFGIEGRFSDLGELLRSVKPDVVHVTTPPQSHHAIGSQCLEAGSHVYIEKPFTVTAAEARGLVDLARSRSLSVTAGHNCQFTPEMIEMRRLIGAGFLGGVPVHLESSWPYDLGDRSYLGPMLGDRQHWVRRLPGQLFHNILSHGIARLAEFLDDEIVQLMTMAHQSQALQRMGGREVRDELRAMMRDGKGATAQFCFSTQIKPGRNVFTVHGPVNSITVDLNSGSVLRHEQRSHKSYLTFVVPPLLNAKMQLANAGRNALAIARMRLHQDAGMKELIERFHCSIATRGDPPIPYREIVLTARVMDMMFTQIQTQAFDPARAAPGSA